MRVSVLLIACCVACTNTRVESGRGATSAVPQSSDSVTGRVVEVGSDPATSLALQPAGGGASLRLEGQVDALRNVTGAEVSVIGTRAAGLFQVQAFTVTRVNGQPVDDGIVVVSGDKVLLRFASGAEREIPYAPPTLRSSAGARVWVSKPVTGVSPSFGVISR